MKKDCQNIEALFENYINKTTTKKLNKYIENHVFFCNDCKEKLKSLPNGNEALKRLKIKLILNTIFTVILLFTIITIGFLFIKKTISYDYFIAKQDLKNVLIINKKPLSNTPNHYSLSIQLFTIVNDKYIVSHQVAEYLSNEPNHTLEEYYHFKKDSINHADEYILHHEDVNFINNILTSTSVSDTQPLYESQIQNYGNLEDALKKGTGIYENQMILVFE